MYYKIYPDVIWIVNLLMDYMVLTIWAKAARITTTYKRRFLGAAVGAVWSAAAACLPGIPLIPEVFFTYFGIAILMLYITGLTGGAGAAVKGVLLLYLIGMIISGFMMLICKDGITAIKLMCCGIIVSQGAAPLMGILRKYVIRKNVLYRIMLVNGSCHLGGCALLDTGNRLTDPYNGAPVNIIEKQLAEKIVNFNDFCILQNMDNLKDGSAVGVRYIPFKSLGRDNGIMRLISIDCMTIEEDGKLIQIEKPEFAVYDGSFSKVGEYGVILNPESFHQKQKV